LQCVDDSFSAAFAPRTQWGLFLRNQIIKACAIPGLAKLAFGRDRLVLVAVITPVFSDRFGASRNDGMMLERAMDGDLAPAYCFGLSTNQLFYVRRPLRCIDEAGEKSLSPPAWLLIPRSTVAPFVRLRPDLEVRSVVETGSGPRLAAVRIDRKSGEK
jgi:hypothetical protein